MMYQETYLVGLGMIAAQVYCIWHCLRNRKPLWWILIILMGFGVIWYFLYEVRGSGGSRGGGMRKARLINLNPGQIKASPRLVRDLEEQRQRGDTVDLRIKLAEAHMELGDTAEAVDYFKSCLTGHHKDDPVVLFGLAQSLHQHGNIEEALRHLEALDASGRTDYKNERALLEARIRAGLGDDERAKERFKYACRLPGEEARCEYALFLKRTGQTDEAMDLFKKIVANGEHGDRDFKRRNDEWIAIAKTEIRAKTA